LIIQDDGFVLYQKYIKGGNEMSTNQYSRGTVEYKQKQKVIEVQIRGFTDVESIKEAKDLITFAYSREGVPLRYTWMGEKIRVLPA
jgi:hypothetical protein